MSCSISQIYSSWRNIHFLLKGAEIHWMMTIIDQLLYRTVHAVLWLYALLCTWLTGLRKPIQIQHKQRKRTLRRCQEDSSSLSKLPLHIGLAVLDGKISFPDVANIVVWCAAVGISYISVYDNEGKLTTPASPNTANESPSGPHPYKYRQGEWVNVTYENKPHVGVIVDINHTLKMIQVKCLVPYDRQWWKLECDDAVWYEECDVGLLKKNLMELTNHISEKEKELLGSEGSKFTVEVCTETSESEQLTDNGTRLNDGQNSICSKRSKNQLYVIGPEDGQSSIARAAQHYCEMTLHWRGKGTDEQEIDVNGMLHARYNFPDPDLILKFGTVSSLFGYLPWQIRLTEIISYPSHHSIEYKSFLSLLHIFAKTEQRFGK